MVVILLLNVMEVFVGGGALLDMFRHADVVCLCLVCILWQFSMLHSA